MRLAFVLLFAITPWAIMAQTVDQTSMHPTPEQVLAGVERRAEAVFRTEAGKPLVRAAKHPPLGKNRGDYVRGYSFSMVNYASRCLVLDEMNDQANAALVENAKYYLDHPDTIYDRDSFHWHAELVLRLIEYYGTNGSRHPGRITPETEKIVLEPIWLYTSHSSTLEKADYKRHQTWEVYGSENHHAMDFTIHWHFSKLAKDIPEYMDRQLVHGGTLKEHYEAWNEFIKHFWLERARKGVCIEMRSDGYNAVFIKGFYNFYDFGDEAVRKQAGLFLDLYFADWAQEQIDGYMGGGGSRIKGNNAYGQSRGNANGALAWLYFGIGEQPKNIGVAALTSDYRPPAVVVDIARDTAGRWRYEIRQRAQGLGKQGGSFPDLRVVKGGHKIRTDGGGIVRYSYCTPAFIMGTPLVEARPTSDWLAISSQSRWQGVVFAGGNAPRIVPVPRAKDNSTDANGFWSVQSKGSLVTQKLKTASGSAEMRVWTSKKGMSEPLDEDGVVFFEAPGAYAAIRASRGGYTIDSKRYVYKKETGEEVSTPPGHIITPDDEYAPVIVEVMEKSQVKDFADFRAQVKACRPTFEDNVLTYKSIYGDTLTFDADQKAVPSINGQAVDYAPKKVFDSPFLNSEYNSGVVTITKGDRKLVLDFNQPLKTK